MKTKLFLFIVLLVSQGILVAEVHSASQQVTVGDYCSFLNAVAVSDPHHLYDESMGENSEYPSILRSGKPGDYSYSVISGEEHIPITGLTWFDEARYCNWLENSIAATGNSPKEDYTETGVYDLSQIDGDLTDKSLSNIIISKNPNANYFIADDEEDANSALASNNDSFYILTSNQQTLTLEDDDTNSTSITPDEKKGTVGTVIGIVALASLNYFFPNRLADCMPSNKPTEQGELPPDGIIANNIGDHSLNQTSGATSLLNNEIRPNSINNIASKEPITSSQNTITDSKVISGPFSLHVGGNFTGNLSVMNKSKSSTENTEEKLSEDEQHLKNQPINSNITTMSANTKLDDLSAEKSIPSVKTAKRKMDHQQIQTQLRQRASNALETTLTAGVVQQLEEEAQAKVEAL